MQNAVASAGSQQINKEIEDRCRLRVAVPDIGLMRMHNMHTDMVHMDAHASIVRHRGGFGCACSGRALMPCFDYGCSADVLCQLPAR